MGTVLRIEDNEELDAMVTISYCPLLRNWTDWSREQWAD